MKKVILLVPDTIEQFVGSSSGSRSVSEDVTPENIKQALCDRSEYHQYYWFESADNVRVICRTDYEQSIEMDNDQHSPVVDFGESIRHPQKNLLSLFRSRDGWRELGRRLGYRLYLLGFDRRRSSGR